MRRGSFRLASCVAALVAASAVAGASEPPKPRPGAAAPPKVATPTPSPPLVRQTLPLQPCLVAGQVTFDPSWGTSTSEGCPGCVRFRGAMRFRANVDLYAVRFDDLYVMDKGAQLAVCGCPACPRYVGDPAAAPPTANIKKGEDKAYWVACIFVDPKSQGRTGPFTIPVPIHYSTLVNGTYTPKQASCGSLALVR